MTKVSTLPLGMLLVIVIGALCETTAFLTPQSQPRHPPPSFPPQRATGPLSRTETRLSAAMTLDQVTSKVASIGATVPKPMGVVFGENAEPYYGLVVDDVSEGMNGGRAGLRKGDQLLAVNGRVVVGRDFDSVMGLLADPSAPVLDLVLYRGPVRDLYTILGNQIGDGESIQGDDDDDYDDDEGSEEVIMDENYESPVRIEVKEEKPLTPADFVKAIGKLGSILAETITAPVDEAAPSEQPKQKKGFFGFGAESIQLDGDDAMGYKAEKPKPDKF